VAVQQRARDRADQQAREQQGEGHQAGKPGRVVRVEREEHQGDAQHRLCDPGDLHRQQDPPERRDAEQRSIRAVARELGHSRRWYRVRGLVEVDSPRRPAYRAPMPGLHSRRIGFVSTRLAGTDGVSLEAAKWEAVLGRLGHTCFWFAGEVDRPPERSRVVPEAFYRHPEIEAVNAEVYAASREVTAAADAEHPLVRRRDFFSPYVRPPHVTRRIEELKGALKGSLYDFLRDFDLDLLVVENALAIPLNLPLGLALAEVVAETGIPVLAHHHDSPSQRQQRR
jgi:hypothetical protein